MPKLVQNGSLDQKKINKMVAATHTNHALVSGEVNDALNHAHSHAHGGQLNNYNRAVVNGTEDISGQDVESMVASVHPNAALVSGEINDAINHAHAHAHGGMLNKHLQTAGQSGDDVEERVGKDRYNQVGGHKESKVVHAMTTDTDQDKEDEKAGKKKDKKHDEKTKDDVKELNVEERIDSDRYHQSHVTHPHHVEKDDAKDDKHDDKKHDDKKPDDKKDDKKPVADDKHDAKDDKKDEKDSLSSEVTIHEDGDGKTFSVKKPGAVVVSLKEDPNSGMKWVVFEKDTLELHDESKKTEDAGDELRVFRFLATADKSVLVLNYENPWKGGDPEKKVTFTILAV